MSIQHLILINITKIITQNDCLFEFWALHFAMPNSSIIIYMQDVSIILIITKRKIDLIRLINTFLRVIIKKNLNQNLKLLNHYFNHLL